MTQAATPGSAPAASAAPRRGRCRLLLIEPDFMMRRAVALTARTEEIAEVAEAASHPRGRDLLQRQPYDAILLSLTAEQAGLDLIHAVRGGLTASSPTTPIAVLVDKVDSATVLALRTQSISRVLIKPCKVRTLLECMQALAGSSASGASG